jgi:2'-5' RNA ligase
VHVVETALVFAVPEAAPLAEPWLERTVLPKPSIGVPTHVTLLYPFVPAEAVDEALLAELGALFARFEPFDFTLTRTARFPRVLYLAPEPAARFIELTEAIMARWPEYPHWEGMFDEIVPHLTVAEGEPEVLDAAEADVVPGLPVAAQAREAVLLEELEPDWVRWGPRASFPLGYKP